MKRDYPKPLAASRRVTTTVADCPGQRVFYHKSTAAGPPHAAIVIAFLVALAAEATTNPICTADVVVITTGNDATRQLRRTGTVVDFTGRNLLLQTASGNTVTIAADRVINVKSNLVPEHLAADEQFSEYHFRAAAQQYQQAQNSEQRVWLRRQIVARRVWCLRYLEKFDRAGEMFLVLIASDPSTQYFDAIPLNWTGSQPDPLVNRLSHQWIQASDNAVARLLGASWLLPTDNRAEAVAVLGELQDHQDTRIANLAATQLWRIAMVSVHEKKIISWQQTVTQMPYSLRAGPYYLVGQAFERNNRHRDAALTLMRVPIHYQHERKLAGECLLAAAISLEKINASAEAINLYREILRDYEESSAAKIAEPRLRQLEEQKK